MDKLSGTVFDPKVPTVIKVSRVASAAILSLCAASFWMILTL